MDIALSVGSIYFFILLGYLAKRRLQEDIQEKSMVILSIYFLQPMLTFWGLTSRPLDLQLIQAPLIYTAITLLSIACSFLIAKSFFSDAKDRSIITIAGAIGNTGNLGIPLGIALFGEGSIIYTSIINVANIFIMYTIGVYFYSRGTFSITQSLTNIVKLPLIWFAVLAIIFNVSNIQIHAALIQALQMGAYASMVLQLIIFGMYLYSVKLSKINIKLNVHVGFIKFVLMPFIAYTILNFLGLDSFVAGVIMLELLVPLAVTNVNVASLYDCKPIHVTSLVLFSSLFFIPYIIVVFQVFHFLQ